MTRRIAGLPVWGPSDVIDGMRAVLGWTDDAVGVVAALPDRVSALLDTVETLLPRVSRLVERIEAVAERAEAVVGRAAAAAADASGVIEQAATVAVGAAGVIERASAVAAGASGVIVRAAAVADRANTLVDQAGSLSGTAADLLGTYGPIANQAAPLARRFVEELSAEELTAAIRLVDQLPALAEHLETDVMPILVTLDRVGPDVHELLDVLKDVRQAINGIPGFGYFLRRGEREEAEGG